MEKGDTLNTVSPNYWVGSLMNLEWYFTMLKDVLIVLTMIVLVLAFLYMIYGEREGVSTP